MKTREPSHRPRPVTELKRTALRDGASCDIAVPYFALSVRGQLTDSTHTPFSHLAPGAIAHAATDESRSEHDRWVAAAVCAPYFELAVFGSVRV